MGCDDRVCDRNLCGLRCRVCQESTDGYTALPDGVSRESADRVRHRGHAPVTRTAGEGALPAQNPRRLVVHQAPAFVSADDPPDRDRRVRRQDLAHVGQADSNTGVVGSPRVDVPELLSHSTRRRLRGRFDAERAAKQDREISYPPIMSGDVLTKGPESALRPIASRQRALLVATKV